jgi:hypothetical protein
MKAQGTPTDEEIFDLVLLEETTDEQQIVVA